MIEERSGCKRKVADMYVCMWAYVGCSRNSVSRVGISRMKLRRPNISQHEPPFKIHGVFARAGVQAIQWRLSGGVGNGERGRAAVERVTITIGV
jgi:hypothetical protein